MQWQDIRNHYPNQWLLLEALQAHSEGGHRILDQIAILGTYADSIHALQDYRQIHGKAPDRELYVFSTNREHLDIEERHWFGIRGVG